MEKNILSIQIPVIGQLKISVTASSPRSRYTDPKALVFRAFQETSFAGPRIEDKKNCAWWMLDIGQVAYGSIQLSGVAPEGLYRFIVDEIIRNDVQLFMEGGTLGDISSGETVVLLYCK
ncbi:hypothetical protein GIB67_028245 [Kingdonia uniflora]|uniref:Uncharacterized protein n=1 Tax=Kingdonia uniflora TaxID=39325 RepID=A0A7J7KZH2_9MAGN|nr:hypothetical protein GIB67_028245 [Kingdonia uniflora]